MRRANLGCGSDIRSGYVNVDSAKIPGVDVVADLALYPWPFRGGAFEEIQLVNVLEHLPNTVAAVEEIHRVAVAGARVVIRVPYWNCWQAAADPTHRQQFHQCSFDFFDPAKDFCRERPYYSHARFAIRRLDYWIPLWPSGRGWVRVSNGLIKALLGALAQYFNSIIWVLEFELEVLKGTNADSG